MKRLAPIVLFTYNRPIHTQTVLDALAKNTEAVESILYIYCDGPKDLSTAADLEKIEQVRTIVKNEGRFLEVKIILQHENKGLAKSIINGVTDVVRKYGKVIVLEDDILVSKGFLKYMNDSLQLYSNDNRVGCIHAWNYNFNTSSYNNPIFFLKGADCWGWATWERAWEFFNPNGAILLKFIKDNRMDYEFNRKGTHDFISMLEDQIAGKNDSWAVRWHASLFINNMFCLHPVKSIVRNIGLDDSGTHCGTLDLEQHPVEYINIEKIDVVEDDLFFKLYKSNNIVKGDTAKGLHKFKSILGSLLKKMK